MEVGCSSTPEKKRKPQKTWTKELRANSLGSEHTMTVFVQTQTFVHLREWTLMYTHFLKIHQDVRGARTECRLINISTVWNNLIKQVEGAPWGDFGKQCFKWKPENRASAHTLNSPWSSFSQGGQVSNAETTHVCKTGINEWWMSWCLPVREWG